MVWGEGGPLEMHVADGVDEETPSCHEGKDGVRRRRLFIWLFVMMIVSTMISVKVTLFASNETGFVMFVIVMVNEKEQKLMRDENGEMMGQYTITEDEFTTWPGARDIKPISVESLNKAMSPDPFGRLVSNP